MARRGDPRVSDGGWRRRHARRRALARRRTAPARHHGRGWNPTRRPVRCRRRGGRTDRSRRGRRNRWNHRCVRDVRAGERAIDTGRRPAVARAARRRPAPIHDRAWRQQHQRRRRGDAGRTRPGPRRRGRPRDPANAYRIGDARPRRCAPTRSQARPIRDHDHVRCQQPALRLTRRDGDIRAAEGSARRRACDDRRDARALRDPRRERART